MKLINPSVKIIEFNNPNNERLKAEYAARTCYASIDRMSESSIYKNNKFLDMLIKNKHYSPLEFATIYLLIPETETSSIDLCKG